MAIRQDRLQRMRAQAMTGLLCEEAKRYRRRKEEYSRRGRSPVLWTFQYLQQLLDIVVGEPRRQPEFSRSNDKRFSSRTLRGHQSQTKKVIDGFLK